MRILDASWLSRSSAACRMLVIDPLSGATGPSGASLRKIAWRSSGMPSPVSAETGSTCSTSVSLVPRSHLLPASNGFRSPSLSINSRSSAPHCVGEIEHQQCQDPHRPSPDNFARFPASPPRPGPCRIPAVSTSLYRNSFDRSRFGNQIACRAGDVRHDRPVLLQQPVEQAALANIRPPRDGQREPLIYQLPASNLATSDRSAPSIGLKPSAEFPRRRDADVVLGKIDSGFEQRDQFQQAVP